MEMTDFFKKMALRESALDVNQASAHLLAQSLSETCERSELPLLQERALIAEVGYAYQHFGFSIFAPMARALLSNALAHRTGVSGALLDSWLETVCYFLLEDFNILKLVDGAPDWDAVDAAFARDLVRRLVCAEKDEAADLGLDIWDEDYVECLRRVAVTALEGVRTAAFSDLEGWCRGALEEFRFAPVLQPALVASLEELRANPLRLLVWRIECFTTFAETRQEAKFFVREASSAVEGRAYKLAALLALFLPHRTPDGRTLLPASPLTLAQIAKVLRKDAPRNGFDCSLMRAWLDLDGDAPADLVLLAKDARALGLMFEVPTGRGSAAYGLTKTSLRILKPFQATLAASLMAMDEGVPAQDSLPLQIATAAASLSLA